VEEKGKLRQSFSQGRTKRVVVEKIKRRPLHQGSENSKKYPSHAAKMRVVGRDRLVSLDGTSRSLVASQEPVAIGDTGNGSIGRCLDPVANGPEADPAIPTRGR
jgi:hypothetical protein